MNSKADRRSAELSALADGRHADPFALLGIHQENGSRLVRTLQPHARSVSLLDRDGNELMPMRQLHKHGLFEAELPARMRHYRLRIEAASGDFHDIEDPYRFPSTLGDLDLHLLAEGSHQQIFKKLGAQPGRLLNVSGTCFAVWAPNASRVSVIGEFNDWDGRCHVMRLHPASGIWEIFIPAVSHGAYYKFEIIDRQGDLLPYKTDPMAHYFEPPPGNASIVYRSNYR